MLNKGRNCSNLLYSVHHNFHDMVIDALKESLWRQFGASIDMLKNAIAAWPEESWATHKKFFYNAYHCLVFLDLYLTIPAKELPSALSFTIGEAEEAVDDVIPNRIYSKKELLHYLQASRDKCHDVIAGLTEEQLTQRWIQKEWNMEHEVLELLLYNMRHVQHHAAQLNMLLRQHINDAPAWVSRAKDGL